MIRGFSEEIIASNNEREIAGRWRGSWYETWVTVKASSLRVRFSLSGNTGMPMHVGRHGAIFPACRTTP